jgi:hypothetical protein
MLKISVTKFLHTGMALFLLFAFTLGAAKVHAAGTNVNVNVNASGSDSCANLPPVTDDSKGNEASKNPKLCTQTPTVKRTSTATATSTPKATATPTNTAPVTSTATPIFTPTVTATATNTPTDPVTPTDTATRTNTPTTVPPANITVYNTGAFFVHYYVSYNLPNLPLQSLYSGVFNINQGVTLTIPGGATNVGILIQNYTGITGWQTACTRSYSQARSVVIIVSGTTFLPSCTGG